MLEIVQINIKFVIIESPKKIKKGHTDMDINISN